MQETLSRIGDSKTCALAIIIRDAKILLGHRHYKRISVWISPGGRCDEGETLEETLHREIEEEIGVTNLTINDYLGELEGANAGDNVFVFLCEIHQEEKLIEPDKFSEWRWFNKEEVQNLPMSENTRELINSLL